MEEERGCAVDDGIVHSENASSVKQTERSKRAIIASAKTGAKTKHVMTKNSGAASLASTVTRPFDGRSITPSSPQSSRQPFKSEKNLAPITIFWLSLSTQMRGK